MEHTPHAFNLFPTSLTTILLPSLSFGVHSTKFSQSVWSGIAIMSACTFLLFYCCCIFQWQVQCDLLSSMCVLVFFCFVLLKVELSSELIANIKIYEIKRTFSAVQLVQITPVRFSPITYTLNHSILNCNISCLQHFQAQEFDDCSLSGNSILSSQSIRRR